MYCLDYLSHRSDPISTNCDNIWVGTGGLCFQWFLLLSPRPSKRTHNLYKSIHTSVIVFRAEYPVLSWLPFYCIFLFSLCNLWKMGKKSVICGSMITISRYFSVICLVVYSTCKYAEASHIILHSADWRGHLSETWCVISNGKILDFWQKLMFGLLYLWNKYVWGFSWR